MFREKNASSNALAALVNFVKISQGSFEKLLDA